MFYIFWGLLNLFFLAGFFVIAYHAVKQIRIKYGIFAVFVFVCVLWSFVGNSKQEDKSRAPVHSLRFQGGRSSFQFHQDKGVWHIPDSTAKHLELNGSQNFVVHQTLLFNIGLHVTYATDFSSKRITPVYAYSTVEGTLSGVDWDPLPPTVNINEAGTKIEYSLDGVMRWKFLIITVYSEAKSFTGSVDIVK